MSSRIVRLAVVSDLHYRRHEDALACRPAVAQQGPHADPMEGLLQLVGQQAADEGSPFRIEADYLLCPGDIADRANAEAFKHAWDRLKELQISLGARHLITTTGNHEVDSRAGEMHDRPGNADVEADPLRMLQQLTDYPSTAFVGSDRRWVYWGRGYEFIEDGNVLFLVINTSHYHWTTRANEFERGRIGDVALSTMREEIKSRIGPNGNRAFIAILHHHPIPHQDLDHDLGKIEMANGPRLMQVLEDSGVTWVVIHGHKHHARLISAQGGPARPIVFAAGSFGARLDGTLAMKTRTQFYVMELHVEDQSVLPQCRGTLRAWAWSDCQWIRATKLVHGLPDGCGFHLPQLDMGNLAGEIFRLVSSSGASYLSWQETVDALPTLGHLMPSELELLRRVLPSVGVNATWAGDQWLPSEVSK